MKFARFVSVVLFAATTFASAAQLNTVPSAGQTFPAGALSTPAAAGRIFANPVLYNTGSTPSTVAVIADVNGDGKLDLIRANLCIDNNCASGSVSVLLGNGDGTFQTAVNYGSGGLYAYSVVLGDVNGDGKLDLVIANRCIDSNCASGSVSVLLGNGDGTFQAAVSHASGALYALEVQLGDVNGDGKLDVVVANECATSTCANGLVSVLLGNGDGTLQTAVSYGSGGQSITSLAVADVNGDGKLDLLIALNCTGTIPCHGAVAVFLGQGNGIFNAPVLYNTGAPHANSLTVADMNADGKLDLLVGSCWVNSCAGGGVAVLLGNGDGSFMPGIGNTHVLGVRPPVSVMAVDVDGDGKLDVLALGCVQNGQKPCRNNPALYLLRGNGDGTFQSPQIYATGGLSSEGVEQSLAVGDLNGDGKLDVLASNFDVPASVFLNQYKATTTITLASGTNPSVVNQAVTFTATVTGLYAGKTKGLVTFKQGGAVLGTAAVVGGKAILTHVFTKTGTLPIKSLFSGDSNSRGSASATLTQVVTP